MRLTADTPTEAIGGGDGGRGPTSGDDVKNGDNPRRGFGTNVR